jgi:release factor glutamine methyltransferase
MPTIADILIGGEQCLADAGIPDPRREAVTLAATALGRHRTFLYAHPEYEPTTDELGRIEEFLLRRADREPLQYIRGSQEFYGLDFEVTLDVLIPRPETEMLVERAINYLNGISKPRFMDIGTGTGCIAISILKHVPEARALAVDISPAAISVSRRNAEHNGVAERLILIESDLFSKVPAERFHLIVSNPPYVPEPDIEGLQPEVRDHEPHLALTDGRDGLSIIAEIVQRAPEFLLPGGHLLVEFGFGQAEAVWKMLPARVWDGVSMDPDLQGIPRMLVAKLR